MECCQKPCEKSPVKQTHFCLWSWWGTSWYLLIELTRFYLLTEVIPIWVISNLCLESLSWWPCWRSQVKQIGLSYTLYYRCCWSFLTFLKIFLNLLCTLEVGEVVLHNLHCFSKYWYDTKLVSNPLRRIFFIRIFPVC